MPTKTEYLLFCDASRDLLREIHTTGPISLSANPPIAILRPTVTSSSFLETMFNANQVNAILDEIRRCAALSYSYDPATVAAAQETLIQTHLAFQLVKPTRWFAKYWFQTDDSGQIKLMA